MSQLMLTNFYSVRKRPASEDLVNTRNKIAHIDSRVDPSLKVKDILPSEFCDQVTGSDICHNKTNQVNDIIEQANEEVKEVQLVHPSVQSNLTDNQKTVGAFSKKTNANNVSKSNETKMERIKLARKELSLGDIRKNLAGSRRLAEMRAKAELISNQIKEINKKKNLQEFKSIELDIPQSPSKKSTIGSNLVSPIKETNEVTQQTPFISPRKVFVSPVKSPSKVPAYIQHSTLAASASTLKLPFSYRLLVEIFRSVETAVELLFNRKERITFNKLKASVQEMLKRNFTEKHLAQIKQLVPDFYNYEIQKVKNFSTSSQKETYEMVISPNFPSHIRTINSSIQLERRRYFCDTLLQVVKKHHAQFLASLDPPIEIPDDKVARWHADFDLENVPQIECAKLPEMPNTEKYSSAQDVLAKARELFKCNTKMERAMEKLAKAKARGLTEEEKQVTGINNNPQTKNASTQAQQPSLSGVQLINPALRNLPACLLEKVKAKQAAKALEAMTRSTQLDENYHTYSRLSDLARTLRNIFVTEKKNVLALSIVLSKLDSSFKSNVSAKDLHKDLTLLTEEVPEWIQFHNIRNTDYLKLNKKSDLKVITSKLDSAAAKYKHD